MKHKLLYLLLLIFSFASCVTVKPSERIFLNDNEMQLGSMPAKNYENYVFSVREAATPTGGNKSSGGCGCN